MRTYSKTCQKCGAECRFTDAELEPLSQTDQLICVKEGLDAANMVKVGCNSCGTASLAPRAALAIVSSPATAEKRSGETEENLRRLAGRVQTLGGSAFTNPGPLFNEERREILTKWLANFAGNLEAAASALATGKDARGNAISPAQVADGLRRMVGEYAKNLQRLEDVCGEVVRGSFEEIRGEALAVSEALASPSSTTAPEPGAARVSETAPEIADSGSPREEPNRAKPSQPLPTAEEARSCWRTSGKKTLIPESILPIYLGIDTILAKEKSREDTMVTGLTLVVLLVAIIAGVVASAELGLHWALGILIGVAVLFAGVWCIETIVLHRPRARALGKLAKEDGYQVEEALELFECEKKEREIVETIGGKIDGLGVEGRSSNLNDHTMEALAVALLETQIRELLTPSRDLEAKTTKLWASQGFLKSLSDDKPFNTIVDKTKKIYEGAAKLLANRERLFEVVDRMASRSSEGTQDKPGSKGAKRSEYRATGLLERRRFRRSIERGDTRVVRSLIESGIDPDARTLGNVTGLMIAMRKGNTEMVRILLDAGADPNARDAGANTALRLAAAKGSPSEISRMLLAAGADPNAREKLMHMTPLHNAAVRGSSDTVRALLEAGVSPNVQAHGCNTPLILASNHGNREVVQILLSSGANPRAINGAYETALSVAKGKGWKDLVPLIESALALEASSTAENGAESVSNRTPVEEVG